jgi:C4-dicarboxylate-specific signal transduction histidine kinase
MATRQSFTASQVLTAAEQNALATAMIAINAQTGTTYTTVLADDGKLITCSNAASIALTIPPNSSVAYGIGTQINIAQLGAGTVTITAGAGVTLNSAGAKLKTDAQYAVATCVKTDTNTWFVVGNLKA